MRLIFDSQFKIVFDDPIKVTRDIARDLTFFIDGLDTAIYDDPDMTVGPRKPNIKDVKPILNEEDKLFTGILFTFQRSIVRTGQIGISSKRIKEITATQAKLNDIDLNVEDMTIEKINIFEDR